MVHRSLVLDAPYAKLARFTNSGVSRGNLRLRYRDDEGKPQTAATLNGTLCAIARTIACLLEVHQRADGSVYVPKALRPWLGGVEELTPGMALAAAVPPA